MSRLDSLTEDLQLLTDKQAAALIGISRATWWRNFVYSGRVSTIKLGKGRCTRFLLSEIKDLIIQGVAREKQR